MNSSVRHVTLGKYGCNNVRVQSEGVNPHGEPEFSISGFVGVWMSYENLLMPLTALFLNSF